MPNPQIAKKLLSLKRNKLTLERKRRKALEQSTKINILIAELNAKIQHLDLEIKKLS